MNSLFIVNTFFANILQFFNLLSSPYAG